MNVYSQTQRKHSYQVLNGFLGSDFFKVPGKLVRVEVEFVVHSLVTTSGAGLGQDVDVQGFAVLNIIGQLQILNVVSIL